MSEEPPKKSSFYDSLKNAQPLAFLASLSIVIAAFTYSNEKLPNVYVYATLASFTFLFSFIFSMISQLYRPEYKISIIESPPGFIRAYKDLFILFSRSGVYFFLIFGIIYLLLVAYEFTKIHLQLFNVLIGWLQLFTGTVAGYAVIKLLTKIKRTKVRITRNATFVIFMASAFSASCIVLAVSNLGKAYLTH